MYRLHRSASRRSSRGGYLYIAVLITTTIVAVIGLAASSMAHLEMNSVGQSNNVSQAQALARSAVENAIHRINDIPAWRTTFTHNTESPDPPESLAGGTMAFKLLDSDGDLADDPSDSVELVGIGRVGSATAVERVRLYPTGQALTCLEASLCCAADIKPAFFADATTNQFVSSNLNVNATSFGTSIVGSAQAAGSVTGTITGTSTSGVTARQLPGSDVFEYYKDNGTWIDFNTLPFGDIDKAVLSPASNPYGSTTNAEGIYVIDCLGGNIEIKNSRIVGTLVLLNPGSGCRVSGAVRWDTVVPNYPALLVDGNIELRHTSSSLSESTLSTNFNPPGTPFEATADADQNDSYPSEIRGLIFVNGELGNAASGGNPTNGVVICRSMKLWSSCTFTYRSTFLDYPPPGFASGDPMRISPGSWQKQTLSP